MLSQRKPEQHQPERQENDVADFAGRRLSLSMVNAPQSELQCGGVLT